ncbi:MAG: mannose-1-phosphate guanylyltransferase [Phycisphaerae bacterium]|nr:mannose-1-phosphate guanylyltransferase [Phycisphaerae bacterium]
MEHAVIMAGGAGTRLWPLSRNLRPKQLLRLFEGKSLLRRTYERLAARFEPRQIYVITTAAHLPMVADDLPELPARNLMGEPVGRDTANAVGMAAALLDKRDPGASMGIFTADHIIEPVDRFRAALDKAYAHVAQTPDALVTFGIRPVSAHTGYGYVHRGASVADGVYGVQQFVEKPDADTAAEYVASGQYYWNSGMFVWRTQTILDELKRNLPDSHAKLIEMADAWDTPDGLRDVERIYPTLEKISIDYAVMQKARKVAVVEMDCRWLDVGSWTSMGDIFDADSDGNVLVANRTVTLDASDNVVVAEDDHLIALIGVKDLVVIRSDDATLICTKESAQQIKDMVGLLKDRHGEQYT